MEQITIKHQDGTEMPLVSKARVSVVTKAEQSVSLLGADTVSVTVRSATPLNFYIGDTIEVFAKTYTMNQLPTVKKTGSRMFEYGLTLEGVQYELIDAKWLLPDNTVMDSFTGDLEDFIDILVENANRVFSNKWVKGAFPENTEYKTLTYTDNNCLEVLQNLCEEYDTEFEIEQKDGVRTLNVKSAGVNFPYTFKYGRTGGLYELTRQNISSKNVVTRLFVYGGSNNLGNKYRYNKLCLPGKGKNASYIENAAAVAAYGVKENAKTFDDIFPNRYGTVTAPGSKYYSFIDNTMNFDLNEKDTDGVTTKWLINGVTAKVKMTTGNLAGYEFEIHKYDHATKEIQVVPFTDENGMKFPSETSAAFQFGTLDKYFFTDINLPDSYKTEAEAKLQEEGRKYYEQYCQPQVQYGLNIDQNFIRKFAGNMSTANVFSAGDYVNVEDTDLGVSKAIRITGFTRDLMEPYKYSLTLGDSVTKTAITRVIEDLRKIDRAIVMNNLTDPSKARRNWRAAQEVLAQVFDPEGHYYSEKIKPLSVETTMLSVGAKSQQFTLQNTRFEANFEGRPNAIKVIGGRLVHYAIDNAVKAWTLADNTTTLDANVPYYIYAKCSRTEPVGVILFDTEQREADSDPMYYYFLIGTLSSIIEDTGGKNPARIVSLTYGASTVNGRFIRTGRIQSGGNGDSYFDLDNNSFSLGDKLSFNINGDGQLVLHGTMVQSGSGATEYIGCYRGAYNAANTYYQGDEVSFTDALGPTSTYRYIASAATSGITPSNASYWKVIAQGSKGADGQNGTDGKDGAPGKDGTNGKDGIDGKDGTDGANGPFVELRFAKNGSSTTAPTLNATAIEPNGWSTTTPVADMAEYVWMTSAKKSYDGQSLLSNWTTPVRTSGAKGAKGDNGENGKSPALVFRGEYDSSKTYYGNEHRVDCVKYGNLYYVARIDAGINYGTDDGSFQATPIGGNNDDYWNNFGATFESVATNFLLANNANIGGWIFNGSTNRLESQNRKPNGEPTAYLDGVNGDVGIGGALQFSTERSTTINKSNLYYLPEVPTGQTVTISQDQSGFEEGVKNIGRVVKFYNSGASGKGKYRIELRDFTGRKLPTSSGGLELDMTSTSISPSVIVILRPREAVEITCFESATPTATTYSCDWRITGRYTVSDQHNLGNEYPFVLAMCRLHGSLGTSVNITGNFWDGRNISSVLRVSRASAGKYNISFDAGTLPTSYMVMATAYNNTRKFASYCNATATGFEIWTQNRDGNSDVDADFLILNWGNETSGSSSTSGSGSSGSGSGTGTGTGTGTGGGGTSDSSSVSYMVNRDACEELGQEPCESCIEVCPVSAIRLDDKGHIEINNNVCTQCGRCTEECPNGAIYTENN